MVKNKKIVCHLPIKDYETIERLVADGWYKSINDFVSFAVKKLIEDEIGAPALDEKTIKLMAKILRI